MRQRNRANASSLFLMELILAILSGQDVLGIMPTACPFL